MTSDDPPTEVDRSAGDVPSAGEPEGVSEAVAPIRVMIVDDHPVVRDGLRGMFAGEAGFEVVAEAADGREAVARAMTFEPDVVLMDLRMPGGGGVAAIRELTARALPSRVLVLTTYDADRDVIAAIDAGATGYLLKDTPREELFRAVRASARGQSSLSPTVATHLLGRVRDPEPDPLSPRELEVLRAVARGATNREVGAQLFISETTVKTHLLHIYSKLGVNDRAAAVAAAYERRILEPGQQGGRS